MPAGVCVAHVRNEYGVALNEPGRTCAIEGPVRPKLISELRCIRPSRLLVGVRQQRGNQTNKRTHEFDGNGRVGEQPRT